MFRSLLAAAGLVCLIATAHAASPIVRDLPPGLQIPSAAEVGPGFNVEKATDAYVNLLSPEQRKLSDQYFEGGYWLQLWELLWSLGACALLLVTGASERMSRWSQRVSRRAWISTPLFIAQILIALYLLELPWSIYADFLRDHRYGLSEQAFGGWLGDQSIIMVANVIILGLALSLVYAVVRRTGARWWIWATGLTWVTLLSVQLVLPVYVLPLLNDYKPLPDGTRR